jgi:hypothetical protein
MHVRRYGTIALFVTAACSPAYVDTLAPKDAKFEIVCGPQGCGKGGREKAADIRVTFGKKYARHYSVCCPTKNDVVARLVTIRDMWCAGLAVPPKTIGELTIAVTTSELSGKRAATIDQGEGYTSFQCDDWLPKLIEALERSNCCSTVNEPTL